MISNNDVSPNNSNKWTKTEENCPEYDEEGKRYVYTINEKECIPMQFENKANPLAHKHHTGLEILEQAGKEIHGFCSGIGTGGTITGIGETLKAENPDMTIWAVEPENAAILSGGSIGTHVQMGIGDGVIPEILNQNIANELSLKGNIIILCGHYKGIDHRIREHLITREVSVGNFVLTGGELAASIMTDAIVRLLPGALGDVESALNDSFQDGLLEAGVYTRPADYKGWKVPEILLSGHQAKIEEWMYEQSLKHTEERRPDLLNDE